MAKLRAVVRLFCAVGYMLEWMWGDSRFQGSWSDNCVQDSSTPREVVPAGQNTRWGGRQVWGSGTCWGGGGQMIFFGVEVLAGCGLL